VSNQSRINNSNTTVSLLSNNVNHLIDTSTLSPTFVGLGSDSSNIIGSPTNKTTVESIQTSGQSSSEWQSYNITSPDFSGATDVSYNNKLTDTNTQSDQNSTMYTTIIETVITQPSSYPPTFINPNSVFLGSSQ
jgi:hypothetical protein